MNQYELEIEQGIERYYVDQSPFGGRFVSGCYTSYGIKEIDAQFCKLIQNIHSKVKELYAINRRRVKASVIKTREEFELEYATFYDPIPLNGRCSEVRVVWENGNRYDFLYSDMPVFDIITGKTNPEQLRKSIKENPNLHVMIKENLLLNLDNYLKHE